jgi:hypothetical protein
LPPPALGARASNTRGAGGERSGGSCSAQATLSLPPPTHPPTVTLPLFSPPPPPFRRSVQGYGPKAPGYPAFVYPGSGATCDTKQLAAERAAERGGGPPNCAAPNGAAAEGGNGPVDPIGAPEQGTGGAANATMQVDGQAEAEGERIEEDPDREFEYKGGQGAGRSLLVLCVCGGSAQRMQPSNLPVCQRPALARSSPCPLPLPLPLPASSGAARQPFIPLRSLPYTHMHRQPLLTRTQPPPPLPHPLPWCCRRAGAAAGGPPRHRRRHPRLWGQAGAVAPLLARQDPARAGQLQARPHLCLRG